MFQLRLVRDSARAEDELSHNFFYKNGPTSEHIYDEAFYRFNSFILKKIHEKYETIKKIKEGIIRKQNLVNLGKNIP
jgi:hypothetical protein